MRLSGRRLFVALAAGTLVFAGSAERSLAQPRSHRRGPRSRRAREAADVQRFRVAADLLRDAGPVRERRPVERSRRADRASLGHGLRPGRSWLVPRRRPEGPDRRMRGPADGPRSAERSRVHGDLGHSGRHAAVRPGRQRRLPRVLGPRLHEGRPTPRDERRLRGFRRLCAPPGDEGVSRRRRQSHRRRGQPGRRLELPRLGRGPLPRLQGEAVLRPALRRQQALPVPFEPLPAAAAARAPAEQEPEAPRLAEPGHAVPQPREHHVRQLLRGLFRAGRLLRARRHLHRAAVRRERPCEGVRRLDPGVPGGRLPRRHGPARRPGVLPWLGAEGPRCRARRWGTGLRDLR